MSVPEPMPHHCLTCRYALDRWTVDGEVSWTHTGAYQGPEHEPVPVPREELLRVELVCDLCLYPNPRWSLLFAGSSVKVIGEAASITQRLSSRWAACTQCAINVEAKDLAGLVRRALRQFENTPIDPRLAAEHLREAYAAILPTYQGKIPLAA